MAQRLFTRAVLALLLPSCAGVAAFSTPTAADPGRPAMPAQACEKTADGFGTFSKRSSPIPPCVKPTVPQPCIVLLNPSGLRWLTLVGSLMSPKRTPATWFE